MAITVERITVGATPVALNSPGTAGQSIHVVNVDATNGVDIGTAAVAAGAGFPLAAGESITVQADAGDGLFAVRSAAADVVLAVLRT